MKKQNKNKEEQIKKLTWKYFIQQKLEEIGKFLLIPLGLVVVIAIFYFIGYVSCIYSLSSEEACSSTEAMPFIGLLVILYLILIIGTPIMLLYLLYRSLKEWIMSNWERAKNRAIEEVKSK